MPRNYSSSAAETQLVGNINSSQTTMEVTAVAGFPISYPYTLILELGTENEEIVDVTAASGTSLTVVRAQDGTSAVSHSAGSKVIHGVSARDFREMQDHMSTSVGVHGLPFGSVIVGDTASQTLTNKTLVNPTVSNGSFSSPILNSPNIGSFINAQHSHADAVGGGVLSDPTLGANRPRYGKLNFVIGDISPQSSTYANLGTPTYNSGMWSAGDSTHLVISVAGLYQFNFSYSLPAGDGGAATYTYAKILKTPASGSDTVLINHLSANRDYHLLSFGVAAPLSVGDKISFYVENSSTARSFYCHNAHISTYLVGLL